MYSVLYVDDEPQLLDLGQIYLQKRWGMTVATALSVQEALEKLQNTSYDAIISDYQMPEMDGISFLKKIRKEKNTSPFILFTGRGREEVVIDALNSGADYYLQKGGNPSAQFSELYNMVSKAVEKKRAENEIRRINHHLNSIINHLPDPTFVVDINGKIISWNHAIEKTTGFSSVETLGRVADSIFHQLYGMNHLSLVHAIINPDSDIHQMHDRIRYDGDTVTAEMQVTDQSQKKVILWCKASPLYNEGDQITGAIETIRDITSIRENEVKLRETNQQLQNIIGFIPDPTFVINNEGRIIAWNRAIEQLTGIPDTEMIGKDAYAYSVPLYSERRPILVDLLFDENLDIRNRYDFIESIGKNLVAELYIEALNDGNGAYLWVIAAPLYDTEGNITGAIESIRDISSRKILELELQKKYEELAGSYEEIAAQNEEIRVSFDEISRQKVNLVKSERQFRNLVEHLPDGVIIHTNDVIRYVNRMAYKILGYSGPDQLIGRFALDIVHPDQRENIADLISKAAVLKRPFFEEIFLREDGTEIVVEVTGIKLQGQEPGSKMTIFRDVSKEQKRKTALRQAQKKLELLSSITRHDVKNQVCTLMSILEMLSDGEVTKPGAVLLQKALIPCNNILDGMKTTFEYQTLGIKDPQWFNIRDIVLHAAQVHQIKKDFYTYCGENAEIYADPLIGKVVENLMDNSVRHGKNLTHITCNTEQVDDHLVFIYEDDGGGIPDHEKKRIFQEGYGKNSGLGLFLINEILAMTGITITERGTYGIGVRFEMRIPHEKWRIVSKPER
ncbi:MAG: PAS domain S-box protein [Methanospirillum sp.]|uniref:PAS domain S-box protein n=1 Tax=Methanospirillum sp. TaxID=45200 RepID=UPI00236A5EDD|nr:response regulator [Methanospirillum sp.]MDD1727910.1 PAS domain S-box protein [Methanospirillum sp.]